MMVARVALTLLACAPTSTALIVAPQRPGCAVARAAVCAPVRRAHAVAAAAKKPKRGAAKGSVDFSRAASTDADGYRRGSFGIGEKESIAIWVVVGAALLLGGGLDDETAQKIGEAQRGFYPKPPGLEQADAIQAKSAAKKAAPPARVFPAS